MTFEETNNDATVRRISWMRDDLTSWNECFQSFHDWPHAFSLPEPAKVLVSVDND